MRVAVLSFAHVHAATYVELLRGRDGIDLVTADPDAPPGAPDRGRALAERLGAAYAGTWDEVFALRPDAVIVTSENARHRHLVERPPRPAPTSCARSRWPRPRPMPWP